MPDLDHSSDFHSATSMAFKRNILGLNQHVYNRPELAGKDVKMVSIR